MIPVEELRQLCGEIDGEVGLYVSVPDSGQRFALNEEAVFYSASNIKIPVL